MSPLHTFTALDFETAQGKRHSICQIGMVLVENHRIVDRFSVLVKPPDNFYSYHNTLVHGISAETTRNSPNFAQVWPHIRGYIADQNLVAHNSAFDVSCLQQTLAYYRLTVPEFRAHCTYKIYGQKLDRLCADHGIKLQHHDALSDATACARLFILHQQKIQSLHQV
ncbi:3'-5' exonuclease [Pedobacter sp. SYSU D00535]|uniref:3'-5' exonuclease n=1 Tax=Pedobacter sp. SYSU D00535 TaxID=2810308 RepID=UPI001A95C34F|nr:3'-5' exonuclease [Pedobacter sp. SYSU D00535]